MDNPPSYKEVSKVKDPIKNGESKIDVLPRYSAVMNRLRSRHRVNDSLNQQESQSQFSMLCHSHQICKIICISLAIVFVAFVLFALAAGYAMLGNLNTLIITRNLII